MCLRKVLGIGYSLDQGAYCILPKDGAAVSTKKATITMLTGRRLGLRTRASLRPLFCITSLPHILRT